MDAVLSLSGLRFTLLGDTKVTPGCIRCGKKRRIGLSRLIGGRRHPARSFRAPTTNIARR